MRALVAHRRNLTSHIAQQYLASIDALDFHFALLAGLEVEAANVPQFVFLGHGSRRRGVCFRGW